MKIEITSEKDNPVLSRKEVKGILTFNKATPSNEDFEQAIAKQLNVDRQCVRAKKIATRYGEPKADFSVFVYSSKDELERIEPAPVKQVEKMEKKAEAAKKAAEEAAKAKEEAKAAEVPKEEKKEENKEEAKPEEKAEQAPKKEEAKPEENKEGDK
ncbi:hypothetical protein GF358_02515 [Candidatus Woesearchaeota archaeon]|nr:hypothetical protein [Candidatus Woesearchaeota archaeon]